MSGATLFLSDLHLAAERPLAAQAFYRFLEGPAAHAEAVYVLGDLFEYWAGDDDLDDAFNAQVAHRIARLARTVPVHVMQGNRDFLLARRFARSAAVLPLRDPAVIDLYGTRTLLMHGDLLCTQDRRYQAFRRVVRNRLVQGLFMRLPLTRRKRIIGGARRLSEGEKTIKRMDIMDVAPAAVEEAFRRHGCTRMIHGHTHRPARHEHRVEGRVCERIVLADWYAHGQYLRVTREGCVSVPLPFGTD
ncbi:MAG: UDP-2,3-diacylglucosamine diphosphatase [Burkholderiales bacterium]|nr:UDP-2,3-diacylglucosamine diphosphatase [Burkholderiales bacterium]